MDAPILKSSRLILRPIKIQDAPIFARWFKDKRVVRYLLMQNPLTLSKEIEWIKKTLKEKNQLVWSILNENKKLIGNTCLKLDKNNKSAVFGIVIGEKDEWGKDYAGETIDLLADYLFKKLKFNRLELSVFTENKGAKKAYKKAGFVLEGIKRKAHRNKITKKFDDDGIMSILREEWVRGRF